MPICPACPACPTCYSRSKLRLFHQLANPSCLLQTDDVGRSEPAIAALPFRRRVLEAVLFREGDRPSKSMLVIVSGDCVADRAHFGCSECPAKRRTMQLFKQD